MMLIRSQCKRYLIDMNGIEIYIVGKEVRASRWVDHYDVMGEYSTEAKAIKVLDMIQSAYTKVRMQINDDGTVNIFSNDPKVFQIPTEEELDEPTTQTIIDDLFDM